MPGSTAGIALSILVLRLVAGIDPASGQSRISETSGRLASCVESQDEVLIDIESSGGRVHFTASNRTIPWPSESYGRTVGTLYRRAGSCPAVGELVRVTYCVSCPEPAVGGIEVGGRDSNSSPAERRLWVVRQFFDCQASRPAERVNLFIASMLLARYNRADNGDRSLWLRDLLEASLDPYRSNERAKAMIDRYGRAELAGTLAPVRILYDRYRRTVGLVKSLPFMPKDARASPFVGAWGTFPLEIWIDEAAGLRRVYLFQ
jgi:hypothetical protein